MSNKNIHYYSRKASEFAAQYNSVQAEAVHQGWLDHIPTEGMALDVGAGSGRDARYLASRGLSVVAVEPAEQLLMVAESASFGSNIHWLNDQLPELNQVYALQVKFDLILVSAVWMHLPSSQRNKAFRKLSSLLKPNGKVVISLRHGPSPDERVMYDVSSSELTKFAQQYGLQCQVLSANDAENQSDQLGRAEVHWETVILTLPDDGTGAFPLLRNVVVNDNKSSTYKLALLRSLLRIAEGYPGALVSQTETQVELPLGLVALYWLKLYKPLLDRSQPMPQNSNLKKGLGFVKPQGWQQLAHRANGDFYLGAVYQQQETVQALHQTLKDICRTIKDMPAKHIKLAGSGKAVFEVVINSQKLLAESLILDLDYLKSFGSFVLPKAIWDSLTRYSVWIEPALVHEWSALMASYGNQHLNYNKLDYLQALNWEDPQRCTFRIRAKVKQLQQHGDVLCCWSGSRLKNSFAVDHAFPFARWPNNDLWNLLPSKTSVNAAKSDRLPSAHKLRHSRTYIVDWWKQAWQENQQEFFIQAAFALPGVEQHRLSYDEVFDGMLLQRDRIKDLQQLADWT